MIDTFDQEAIVTSMGEQIHTVRYEDGRFWDQEAVWTPEGFEGRRFRRIRKRPEHYRALHKHAWLSTHEFV